MKRKNSNKTGIIAAVVGLSAVSLVSVGFASWVMSGGDQIELAGTIDVDTVEDNRFYIYDKGNLAVSYGTPVHGSSAGNAIVFGIDDDPAAQNAWLTAKGSGTKYEQLSASVTFWVANLAANATNVTAVLSADAGYSSAASANLVGALPTVGSGITVNVTNDTDNKEADLTFRKVIVSVQFSWGSYFGGVNPYSFYNAKSMNAFVSGSSGATWGDDARTKLSLLETYLGSVGFTLTLRTTVAA